ncbi:MAG: FG-GAP-like repeat-containing protein [Verrucomicrobiota bacterium]
MNLSRCQSTVIFLLALGLTRPLSAQSFTQITSGNVVTDAGNSHGMAWGDYDGDGNLDLFVANAGGLNNFLYHNNGDGTFTKITTGTVVNDGGNSTSCAWGDYDNDGHLDLFVANAFESNFLYHNNGNGTFAKVTSGAIVTDVGGWYGCAWGDYDNDGYIDLYVANATGPNMLYHNNRDGTFSKVTGGSIVTDNPPSNSCAWGDYDNDGWLDLFVARGLNQDNSLYHNSGDGTFTKVTTGGIVVSGSHSTGCAWGDYDNDGYLDLYVPNRLQPGPLQPSFLFHNNGNGIFTRITSGSIVTDINDGNGCSWGDYNNDGYLDLFVANWRGQSDALYQNNGDGTFTRIMTGSPVTAGGDGTGCGWSDFNNDGKLDLFVANSGGQNNFLYRNEGNNSSWITIRCVGTASNRSGIGARIKVDATIQGVLRSQLRQVSSGNGWDGQALNAHFGLGNASVIATLRVEWPSGVVQTLNNVAVNQTLTVTELAAPPGVAVVTTLAGSGAPGFEDGQGVAAQFHFPNGAFVDAGGFVYIADAFNHRIRRVSPSGAVTTLAGSGAAGYLDGPGAASQFNYPLGVFVATAGDVFVADTENNLVRKISAVELSTVSTVAGSGRPGYVDGPGTTAELYFPNDLVVDAAGNVFVSEFNNHTIRKIAPDGAVSTFVGNGTPGYTDGRGTSARLNRPGGLAIDRNGNFFVTDWGNQRIRKITPDGSVTTLAGSGQPGFVDGPASIAQFNEPDGITVDQDGNVFITEHSNHAVRKIARDGTVTTIAGKGAAGFADGTAAVALFNAPGGIGIDSPGNLFVADTGNNRIRKIAFRTPPEIVVQPLSQSVALGAAVSFVVVATGTPPLSYQWRINGTNWNGRTQPTLVISNVTDADAGSWTVVVSNALGSVTSAAAELSVVTTPPVVSSAIRQLPAGYFPGIRFAVTIAANPPIGTTVYAVEDHPPVGWSVANLNDGGRFDALNQTVKFGPFFDADARVLSYEITPSANESGPKKFSGTISVDGSSLPIGGADIINSESLHPADAKPADHRIAIDELTAYSAAWRKGQSWVNPPNPIPIDYVTRAGALWKNGETYHVDPSVSAPPLWWVNDTNGPSIGTQRLTVRTVLTPTWRVTADTPDYFIITEPFTVTLNVSPSAGVSVYAAEDQISYPGYPAGAPSGLQVTNISHNGEYDSKGRQIRWGPFFDNQPRDLSYQVVMPSTPPRVLDFTGTVSFDGAGVQVAGKRQAGVGSRLNLIPRQTADPIQLQLLGSGTYRIEASTNLIDWATVMEAVVLKDLRFIELNSGKFDQRYYRAREIR